MNPQIVETQMSGAAIMQFGFTMQEKIEFDGGQITNASFADYKIPSIVDIPPDAERSGGGRAGHRARSAPRAWARVGTFGVSPAIANAIEDACGVRLDGVAADRGEGASARCAPMQGRPLEE